VTAIITEEGVIHPPFSTGIKELSLKYQPWSSPDTRRSDPF